MTGVKFLIGAVLMGSSFLSWAGGNLQLQSEIIPHVLNGKLITDESIGKNNVIKLKDGGNQLAVTVGQIVFEDGRRRKFDSQPVLLEFTVSGDQALSLSYERFRTIDEAKAFDKVPQFSLQNTLGQTLDTKVIPLPQGGFKNFRDYEQEVAAYNKQQQQDDLKQELANSPGKITDIKASFIELSREEQQSFMVWAMQNLKQ